jgi:uncharacterized protein
MVRHESQSFAFKIKSIDDAGTFVGMAAVFSNVDLGNDVIDPGAFTRTLSAGKKFPVLWQHQSDNPIGSCTATETRDGLQVVGKLELEDPTAQKAYTFMKAGITKGLSIGYDTIDATYVGDVRHLTEIRLWEASIVTFPMNESAQVTGVKALSDDERLKHLKGLNEDRKAIDRHQRSQRMHLKALFDVPDDDDDVDDPPLEGDGDDDDKALLVELQKLAEQAQELAGAKK